MERRHTIGITPGVMFALFMAAVETTVVATAMPTIISELGGVESYRWVFSVYLLASTTTIPLYGRLSDRKEGVRFDKNRKLRDSLAKGL